MLDEFERIGARLDEFQDWGEDWRSKTCAGLLTLDISRNLYMLLQIAFKVS
jgi:hypothetical protein